MPNASPIQSSFGYGEITPKLRGRTQSEEYNYGLAYCENFRVTPQGTLEKRNGSRFIENTGEQNAVARTFRQIGANDKVVVIGDNNVTMYDVNGVLESLATANLITDPTFLNGFADWTTIENTANTGTAQTQAVSNVGCRLRATCNNIDSFANASVGNAAVYQDGIVIPVLEAEYTYTVSAEFLANTSNRRRGGFVTISLRNGSNLAEILGDIQINYNANTTFPSPVSVPNIGEVEDYEITFDLAGRPDIVDLTVLVQVFNDNQNVNPKDRDRELNLLFKNFLLVQSNIPPIPVVWSTPTSWIGKLKDIQVAMDSATGTMIFTVLGGNMHILTYVALTDSWVFSQYLPTQPSPNLWDNNQPSVCAFHQGRLYLGAAPDSLSTIWASRVWDYFDFEEDNATPEDPLDFQLAVNGKIQWMLGLKTLLIGTDLGQVVGTSTGSVITADDFNFATEQTWGSAYLAPAATGREAIFVSPELARVRTMIDGGDSSNSYESIEPSIIAEHILRKKICQLTYAENPHYELSAIMLDGTIADSCYFKAIQANGWWRETTQGSFISAAVAEDQTGSSKYVLVDRDGSGLYIEIYEASSSQPIYQDSYVRSVSTGVIQGLQHLEGKEVQIVVLDNDTVNGDIYSIHPSLVVENGEVTLEDWTIGKTVAVGLGYAAIAVTNDLEGTNPDGTALTQKRRFNEVFARVYESAMPILNGNRPPSRTPPDLMTNGVPLFSGDVSVYDSGYNKGVITVEQDLPLPTNISALYGKAQGNKV